MTFDNYGSSIFYRWFDKWGNEIWTLDVYVERNRKYEPIELQCSCLWLLLIDIYYDCVCILNFIYSSIIHLLGFMWHSILRPNKSQTSSVLNLYRVWVMNHSFFWLVSLWLTLPMDIINLRCGRGGDNTFG